MDLDSGVCKNETDAGSADRTANPGHGIRSSERTQVPIENQLHPSIQQ